MRYAGPGGGKRGKKRNSETDSDVSSTVSSNNHTSLARAPMLGAPSRSRHHHLISSASSSSSTLQASNHSHLGMPTPPPYASLNAEDSIPTVHPFVRHLAGTLGGGEPLSLAQSILCEEQQRQRDIRRLEELAMIQTMQQIRDNPGLLNSLSAANSLTAPPTMPPPEPINPLAALPQADLLLRVQLQQQLRQQEQDLILQQALMAAGTTLPPLPLPPAAASVLPQHLPSYMPPPPIHAPNPCASTIHPVSRVADLSIPHDENVLSEHQVLLRQQIEFFEATPEDVQAFTPSRRLEISVGQAGIRCKHCARNLPPPDYVRGTMYFPSTLRALYQAAQNMGSVHLSDKCPTVSHEIKTRLLEYMEKPTNGGRGGKQYWADCAMARGIQETEMGLRFH